MRKRGTRTVQLTARVPLSLYERLKDSARASGVSLSRRARDLLGLPSTSKKTHTG